MFELFDSYDNNTFDDSTNLCPYGRTLPSSGGVQDTNLTNLKTYLESIPTLNSQDNNIVNDGTNSCPFGTRLPSYGGVQATNLMRRIRYDKRGNVLFQPDEDDCHEDEIVFYERAEQKLQEHERELRRRRDIYRKRQFQK